MQGSTQLARRTHAHQGTTPTDMLHSGDRCRDDVDSWVMVTMVPINGHLARGWFLSIDIRFD